jgi:integrase
MDKIEDENGARMADVTLSYMRSISDWYAKRDDNYISPFVRKMKRSIAKPRSRILDDKEIRELWSKAGAAGTFGAFVRMLLLTGQRRDVVQHMRWEHIESDVWTIPQAERAKGTAGKLKLPALALSIIKGQPEIADNPYVFASGRTRGPVAIGTSQRQVKADIIDWRLHDLRRSARSLLARAGINREVAERVLGHTIKGVEGTYNRFDYFEEKAHALAALAKLIEEILEGSPDKVVPIRRAAN